VDQLKEVAVAPLQFQNEKNQGTWNTDRPALSIQEILFLFSQLLPVQYRSETDIQAYRLYPGKEGISIGLVSLLQIDIKIDFLSVGWLTKEAISLAAG